MDAFGLRAWDPEREDWALVLSWTTDGDGSFGPLRGRGESLAGTGASRTRYTFSDALPATVRRDSATTADGGVTWRTDWIMEFTRTPDAAEVTQEQLLIEPWNPGELSPHAEARAGDGRLVRARGHRGVDGELAFERAEPATGATLRAAVLAREAEPRGPR